MTESNASTGTPPTASSFPKAIVSPSRSLISRTRMWWLTALSLIVAIALVIGTRRNYGPKITIHFAEGHGLKAGDALRYRGIAVGEVTDVTMAPKLDGIVCTVVLEHQSESLARRGSDFWVERPQISLTRLSGLETVVGGKHLGVRPGPVDGRPTRHFEGLESPPSMKDPDPSSDFAEIIVRFADGRGLQVGDPMRHRGIVIGEVTAVDLEKDLSSVLVRVRLKGMARQIAREGTQIWVERPRLSINEVRGLDTIVGGRYLAVLPGLDESPACTTFAGLETLPVEEIPAGAIEILLHAPQRWGIDRGVPITYRGLNVGQVHSVGLSADGTRVEARASVDAKYRTLVRRNSVFWSTSGVDIGLGFTGLQFSAETLSTIAQGGLAFATPNMADEPANSGHRFAFDRRAPDGIADWNPHIDIHQANRSGLGLLPEPQRAVVRWTESALLGMTRSNKERSALVMLLDNQKLIAPLNVLVPTERPIGDVILEVAGVQLKLDSEVIERDGLLARTSLSMQPDGITLWPVGRIRTVKEPEDALIITDPQSAPHPLAASSLKLKNGVWELHSPTGVSTTWHGAPVIAAKDGQLIGTVVIEKNKPVIVLLGPQ